MKVRFYLLILLCYGLMAVFFTFPLIVKATEFVPMSSYLSSKPWIHDHWVSLWGFWLAKRSLLTSGEFPLFTEEIFYPSGVKMPWATTALFPMIASIPLQAAFGLVFGSNILLLFFTILAAYGAFLLVHDLLQDRLAAFLAGSVFGYSPFILSHLQGHDFVIAGASLIPWYTLFLIRTLRHVRWSNALVAALFFWLTLLSAWYYVPLLAILSGILYLGYLLDHRGQPLQRGVSARLLLLIGAVGIASLPIIAPMRSFEIQDLIQQTPDYIRSVSLDLLAFFVPSPDHFLLGHSVQAVRDQFLGDPTLQTVYLGYAVLFLACLAVLRAPRQAIRPWLWAAIVFFLLALGPTLHINGAETFSIGRLHFRIPLPFAILGYLPFLPYFGGGTAIGLSAVMVMLALSVLAGYGMKHLRQMVGTSWAKLVPTAVFAVIFLEYAILPFPLWQVSVPQVYHTIKEDPDPITVLDLPFGHDIKIYQFYQTVHGKKIMHGFLPRLPSFNRTFGENIRLMRMLRKPGLIPPAPLDRSIAESANDVMRLFKIRYIVIHKDYFASDAFNRVAALINATLPVQLIAQDQHITAYRVQDEVGNAYEARRAYLIDFGAASGFPALLAGWSHEESSDGLTYAWSNAPESTLWLNLPKVSSMKMDLRLSPFSFPSSPKQLVKIFMNGELLSELELGGGWQTYSFDLPPSYLREGVNRIRFLYRYTASPAQVLPGSNDPRLLAVAFDYLTLQPE